MKNKLDEIKSDFYKGLDRLDEGLNRDFKDDIILDGIIQRFEFVFEQSIKLIQLYLKKQKLIDEDITQKDIIKCAYIHKLIQNDELWIEMMLEREIASLLYDKSVAIGIVYNVKEIYILEFKKIKEYFIGD